MAMMFHRLLASTKQIFTQPRTARILLDGCIVVALMGATIGERAYLASQQHIMPAGDVFNFQSIARGIRHWDYPQNERRLPTFPLTIAVGNELHIDPLFTATAVNILSSAVTLALLYLLGRYFTLHRLPLAAALFLFVVAPLPTINGTRPLSDGFFLFIVVFSTYIVTVARPTRWYTFWAGITLTLLAFTRYEGFPIAFALLFLLRFRMPWKTILFAAAPLMCAMLLWLPVAKHINGSLSFTKNPYLAEARETEHGDSAKLPSEYLRVFRTAGWGPGWNLAAVLLTTKRTQDQEALLVSYEAWLSLLGSIGIFWIMYTGRKKALPLLITFALYPILPAWWFLYSRYVAPISALYFLAIGAGASALWSLALFLLRRTPSLVRIVVGVGLGSVFIWIILSEAPILMKQSASRVFENNGLGYAMYQGISSIQKEDTRVGLAADYVMGLILLGAAEQPKDALNPGRGIYLSGHATDTPEEKITYLRSLGMQKLLDNGEPALRPLVSLLKMSEAITDTQTFTSRHQDGDVETTFLYTVDWSRYHPARPTSPASLH